MNGLILIHIADAFLSIIAHQYERVDLQAMKSLKMKLPPIFYRILLSKTSKSRQFPLQKSKALILSYIFNK